MSIELKRCPACGSEANTDYVVANGQRHWGVACSSCWCCTQFEYATEERAAEAWNTRVEDPALERLKQAAMEYAGDKKVAGIAAFTGPLQVAAIEYAASRKEKP